MGTAATPVINVQPLDQVPNLESIGDTVDEAINRALHQRPDLLQQLAEIRSSNARVMEAKAAYYPSLTSLPAQPFRRSTAYSHHTPGRTPLI